MITLLTGDVRDMLQTLPANSVQCVVTSPPYYGLRDYGTAQWEGGDADCQHVFARPDRSDYKRQSTEGGISSWTNRDATPRQCSCGARRIDQQLGLEATPEAYLATMVQVFREVRRVLRDDGTCWVNMGDGYAGGAKGSARPYVWSADGGTLRGGDRNGMGEVVGAKPKDLLMMPARLALALQADGWWLRSEITWCKKNPMPESVRDRPANATEKVYLLTKQPRYFYDYVAAAEPTVDADAVREYHSAYDTLHDMPDREGRRGVRQGEARQERETEGMPLLRYIENATLASHTRGPGEGPCSQSEASCEAGAASQDGGISPFGEDEGGSGGVAQDPKRDGVSQGISGIGQAEGSQQAPLRGRQGQSFYSPVSGDREGESVSSAWCSQASGPDEDHEHADGSRVERDQGECGPQVSLLPQEDESVDDGPCDPADQGRQSHSVEHRSSVPELQFQQGQSRHQSPVRNGRNWWLIATAPYKNAHFATFPPELAERCIRAGTSERGCCAQCGKPWVRVTERTASSEGQATWSGQTVSRHGASRKGTFIDMQAVTTGWAAGCQCNAEVASCVVLDCFSGAGTALLVADRLGRDAIGIDLSHQYMEMTRERLTQDCPLFADINDAPAAEPPEDERMADLFQWAAN